MVLRAAALPPLAAAVLCVAAAASPPEPTLLAGAPLRATGLRLLVADEVPFVLDVDSGRSTRVPGIEPAAGVLWVIPVGGRGAVVVLQGSPVRATLYGVQGLRVARLGTGATAVPAADGRSVWITARDGNRCTLRRTALDGRLLRAARGFPCGTSSDPAGGRAGLVVGRTRLVDPASGRTLRRTPYGVLAVAGTTLVLAGPGRDLTLLDATTDRRRVLARPDTLRGPAGGAVDPEGRFAALEYAEPAWDGGGTQALDIWLVDAWNGRLERLPGMPADVALKATATAWTADGRLVLLGEDRRGALVAVWRPGGARPAVKCIRLPERRGDSDSFAVLG